MADKKEGFGERLRALRIKRGLTQTEIAHAISTHYGTYQRWEYGYQPRRESLDKLVDFLGCSKAWLLTGEGVPFPGRAEPGVGEAEGLWGQTKRQEAEGQTFDITEFEAEAGVGPGPSPAPGLPGDILAELGITLAEFYKLFREYCDIMEKDEVNRVWFFLEMMRRFPYFKDWVKKRRAVDAKEKMGTAEAVGE